MVNCIEVGRLFLHSARHCLHFTNIICRENLKRHMLIWTLAKYKHTLWDAVHALPSHRSVCTGEERCPGRTETAGWDAENPHVRHRSRDPGRGKTHWDSSETESHVFSFYQKQPTHSNKVLKHFFPTLTLDSEATDRPCFSNKWFLYSVTTALVLFACAARLTVNHIIIKNKNAHTVQSERFGRCVKHLGDIF